MHKRIYPYQAQRALTRQNITAMETDANPTSMARTPATDKKSTRKICRRTGVVKNVCNIGK